jgi:hypothetical protein
MPCNSAPSPEFSKEDLDAVEIYFQAEVDRVTRVACEAIKLLKRNALYSELSAEAKTWSHEHDAWDAARTLIERSVKVTVRRPTFNKKGEPIKYLDGDGYPIYPLCDDDIADLQVEVLGEMGSLDRDLAQQVHEGLVQEDKQAFLAEKKKKAKKKR